jgi:hypothetical protein
LVVAATTEGARAEAIAAARRLSAIAELVARRANGPTHSAYWSCDNWAKLIRNGAKSQPVRHPGDAPTEPGYRPLAALERFIRRRDMTCRFPDCDHPAEFADIDRTIAYPLAPTHASNLKCLCRKHHLLKTFHTGWRDEQHPDGTIV